MRLAVDQGEQTPIIDVGMSAEVPFDLAWQTVRNREFSSEHAGGTI